MPDAQVVFRLRLADGLEVADEFADIVFLPGERESPRIEGTPVPRGGRRVFHCILIREVAAGWAPTLTIFSSTPRRIFAGAGQRRIQVQYINSDRTGLAVGGRRLPVLYRIGVPAAALEFRCRRAGFSPLRRCQDSRPQVRRRYGRQGNAARRRRKIAGWVPSIAAGGFDRIIDGAPDFAVRT
jgi:hypothetical protein